jgi:RHS repeat-associated protein
MRLSSIKYKIVDAKNRPFGMLEPGRKFTQGNIKYRYGFNGKENDNDVKGEGNQQDYGFRIYDPRLGRFLSQDPLFKSYPWYTPYQFAGNKPIAFIDRDGLEEARADEIAYAAINIWDANHVRINKNVAFELAQNSGLPNPGDGKQDAFRHTLWNAMNARDIGADDAEPFATRHESGSDANDPEHADYDPVAVRMDLFNNAVGRRIGAANPDASDEELGILTRQALANGELKEIKIGVFNVSVPDVSGKPTIQPFSLPISAKGNPITANAQQVSLLQSSGFTVEGNPSKVLVNSSIPTVAPNKNKTPPLSPYNGGTTPGNNIPPVHSEQPAVKKPIPVKL